MLTDARDLLATLERELPPHPPARHALKLRDDGRLCVVLAIGTDPVTYDFDPQDLSRSGGSLAIEIIRREIGREASP